MRKHAGDKPYACTLCAATLIRRSDLKNNIRIHTGENPFIHVQCDATFTQRSNLNTHYDDS